MLFKKLLVGLIGVMMLTISVCSPAPAQAEVVGVSPDTIAVDGKVHDTDFLQFYKLTIDPAIRHYTVILNTPGGNAWACVAIMNRMKQMKADGITFTTEVYSMAMSAGTYIFLMGDTRIMHDTATLMFHGILAQQAPWQREALQKDQPIEYNILARLDNYIMRMLMKQTGWTRRVANYWINGGTAQYMSATTAYNTGVATELRRY